MGLLSFFIEFPAASLLGMALLFACIGRLTDRTTRHFSWVPVWLLFSFFYLCYGICVWVGYVVALFDHWWVYVLEIMILAFIGGSLLLAFRGMRTLDADGRQTVAGTY